MGAIYMPEKWFCLRILSTICIILAFISCTSSPQTKEAGFLKNGRKLLANKDYSRAVLEFKNAAQVMPKDAEPYYQTGLAYLELDNLGGAIGAFEKALKLNPQHAGAQTKLAGLMTTSRKKEVLEDAEKRLRELMITNPANIEALDALAVTELRLGRPDDANRLLDEALLKSPADLQSAVLLAQLRMEKKDILGAEEVLKKAVANAPRSTEAALALGRFYMQLRKTDKAEPELRRALRLNPKYAPALYSLALVHINDQRPVQAEQALRELASLSDLDYKSYRPLYGLFLFQSGKRAAALEEFEKCAKASPDDRTARNPVDSRPTKSWVRPRKRRNCWRTL